MSALIRKQISFIRLLSETKSKLQKNALLDTITRDQIKAIIEITYNVLHLNVPVSKTDKKN